MNYFESNPCYDSNYFGFDQIEPSSCDDFTTFSNLLFDVDDDFSSSDDESFFDEDISKEIYSNPLFDEKIISIKIDPHPFNDESDLIESILNHDSSIISSSLKIDSLLDEFAGELIFLKSIPPGIDEADCDSEKEICLIKKLLYDNSSPHDDSRILTVKVVGDISEHDIPMPRVLPTQPTLVSNQEKYPHLISHRGLKAFQLLSESPMMIYGRITPILDVPFLHFYSP
nr:hypothetical protein [Tanacetum cinerariifolium]GFB73160.1 hypothetical protein [Tanacetum cinerariifolium]